jgi:hypothetical protein
VAAVAEDSREQQLAWEARQRPRAAIAAILGGVLTIAGYLWWGLTLRDAPRSGFLESLQRLGDGPIGPMPSQLTSRFEFLDDRAIGMVGSGIVRALALFALAWAVTFLAVATRARRTEFIRPAVYVTMVGAVASGIALIVTSVGTTLAVSSFLDGPRTVDEATDFGGGSVFATGELLIYYICPFVIGAGLLLVSLNAMRAGLLTRFLGILGVVSGVLAVLPQLMPLPVIQAFWLVAVGTMLLGGGRAGMPPAWRTGKAEPWPGAVQAANRRREAEERRQGIEPSTAKPAPPAERVPAGKPHPASSKKRKRKRRD